jgi:hypothetical protein
VYWIGISRDYFDKNNLEDFKRLCEILRDFFQKNFLQSRFLTHDLNGF